MGKYIIFISDDFGMTHSINKGIVKAMTEGVVTASNFMVPTPWFLESINYASDLQLPIGIHLNLTCEWENYRWRPLSGNNKLCQRDGTFFKTYKELLANADSTDIYREYKSQIDYLLSLNWNITHIDTHMLPPVFCCHESEKEVAAIVEQIAKEYGHIYLYGCNNNKSRYFDSYFEKSGKDEQSLYNHLSQLQDGFHLVVTHCAVESDEQVSITTKESQTYDWALDYRKEDLKMLTSQKLKNYLIENDFEMITIPQLIEKQNL